MCNHGNGSTYFKIKVDFYSPWKHKNPASLFSRGTEKKHWFEMCPVDLFLVDI